MVTPRPNFAMAEMSRADNSGRRRAIVILGMHRSGTSALARLLGLFGADLPARLMEPNFANEKGYWESTDIVAIHDEMLSAVGSSWDDVAEFPLEWLNSPSAESFKTRLRHAFGEAFGNSPLAVIKDPRICRFVPLWTSILESMEIEPLFVLPVRNPIEVAASLRARDERTAYGPFRARGGMPEAKALLLWMRHFLDAEHHTRGFTRSFVSYEQLLVNWPDTMARLARDLQIEWSSLPEDIFARVEDFLSKEMQHHISSNEELDARLDVPQLVKDVSRWAYAAAVGRVGDAAGFDRARHVMHLTDTSLAGTEAGLAHSVTPGIRLDGQHDRQHDAAVAQSIRSFVSSSQMQQQPGVVDIVGRVDRAGQPLVDALGLVELQRSALIGQFEAARSSASQLTAERDAYARQLEEARTEVRAKAAEIEGQAQEAAALAVRLDEATAQFDVVQRLHQQRVDEVADLRSTISERDEQIVRLRRDAEQRLIDKDVKLRALRLELATILKSRAWRVTASLRKLAARAQARQIGASPLFDADYYLATYSDVRDAHLNPAAHYLLHGWRELRNPSAAFDTARYLSSNPDVAEAGLNPLVHYLRHGRGEGRPLGSDDATPSPAPQISLDAAKIDAEVHAIKASGLFDETFYLSMYQDLRPVPLDPVRHYCEHGWREGRNPSDDFDTRFYLKTYKDIDRAALNPLWHYVLWGAAEFRGTLPDMSPRYEDEVRFGSVTTDIKLLAFYASPDWPAFRRWRSRFTGHSQPTRPNEELGYYDPLDWEVLKHQAQMATRHGIYGFCFDLKVASGTAVGPQPLEQLLAHDEIDIRFCTQIAISSNSPLEHVAESLVRAFADRRQIDVEGRPVLLVKPAEQWDGMSTALAALRRLLVQRGAKVPFVIAQWAGPGDVEAMPKYFYDAALDMASVTGGKEKTYPVEKNGVGTVPYSVVASNSIARIERVRHFDHPLYHTVTLGRDNTTKAPVRPLVFTRFHVGEYRRWLDAAIASARKSHRDDRRFVLIDAWNDWTEGLYLEPDEKSGFSRLNETTRALLGVESEQRTPKVSVIVPNYNHQPFLRRRLDSIYGQTYKNIEVILLDDCSQDESRSILEEYANRYADVTRATYNNRNSGSAFRQWAKGIKQATGDLIWIAESDDYCDEYFLETLVRCFDDEAVLLAYGNPIFVDREGELLEEGKTFDLYVRDLDCGDKWGQSYVETAHNEVISALGIKNTIPNASGAVFRRPVEMPLLDDESWLSMRVAGDWVFYLHVLRGGKIAFRPEAVNFFRRYQGSTAELTYDNDTYYREFGIASRTVATLYDVPTRVLERCRDGCKATYLWRIAGGDSDQFACWYDFEAVMQSRSRRSQNIMVTTMGFFPGGAEILPIRMANEFKRQGHSVLLLSAGLFPCQDGVRRLLRNDVPVVETSDIEEMRKIIGEFGIEVLNTHQWHIQKYPLQVPDVFDELRAHVASLHGMIEHGEAFETTEAQLRGADKKVTTWVYTAEKNIGPFVKFGLADVSAGRFVKLPNGMQPPNIVPISRAQLNIPQDAFVLCCVSRAIPEKGWAETIEAVEIARRISSRDIRLILVGNGPVHDELSRTGTPEFVYLAGFNANSVGHYAASDMGIMLTKFKSESFPLTIVDCLFAGKPYIASDVGDIRNILTVENEVAGSVIELDNWEIPVETAARHIASFASDRQKYLDALTLVSAAANRYRIDVVASQYIELFEAERGNPRLGERTMGDSSN